MDSRSVGVLGTTAPTAKPRQSLVYSVRDVDRPAEILNENIGLVTARVMH